MSAEDGRRPEVARMTQHSAERAVKIAGNSAVLTDGTTWPLPDVREDGLAWRLTYGVALSSAETARLASIVGAYGYLVTETNRDRRAQVVRDLRAALDLSTPPGSVES